MYSKIMVPLDGSKLAECVLPHLDVITSGCGVRSVIFISVVEHYDPLTGWGYNPTKEERQSMDKQSMKEAETYLNKLVSQVKYEGVEVKSEVIMGKAADTLADYADKNDIDLILISSHGRSGVSRWVLGSVAERLLRSSSVPVLVVRSPGGKTEG
jgi:nucleotide-binding universal stress UspA family protein